MITEVAVERFEFACGRCDDRWQADFEVRRATSASGETRASYFRHGLPCLPPSAAQSLCVRCGCGAVYAKPLGNPDSQSPATAPDSAGTGIESAARRIRHALQSADADALARLAGKDLSQADGEARLRITDGVVQVDVADWTAQLGRDANLVDVVVNDDRIIACLTVTAAPVAFPVYILFAHQGGRTAVAEVTADARDALARAAEPPA